MQPITFGGFAVRRVVSAAVFATFMLSNIGVKAQNADMLIDDFADHSLISRLGSTWRGVSDRVMGGISDATISHQVSNNGNCMRLTGDVRLDNNGGFIQAALDLQTDGDSFDASKFIGIRLVAQGNGEQYSVHLRTPDNRRPWQSYRAHFVARPEAQTFNIPFSDFVPYRIAAPLDTARLRIGAGLSHERFDLPRAQLNRE